MRHLWILSLIFVQLGCSSLIVASGCAINSKPVTADFKFNITADILSAGGGQSLSQEYSCRLVEQKCGGGDWYSVWQEPAEPSALSFDVGEGKRLQLAVPDCGSARAHFDRAIPMPNAGYSQIMVGKKSFSFLTRELQAPEARQLLGFRLVEYKIQPVPR